MNAHNVPAMLRSLPDVVAEYDKKAAAISDEIQAFYAAVRALEVSSCVGGAYGGSIWTVRGGSAPEVREKVLQDILRKSAWKHVYDGLFINDIASAADRKRFALEMENPPEFALDNIGATFGTYLVDRRHHILRGLAECFCDLDPAYKSHSKVKIGVAGLPKRIILSSVGGYGSWGFERLRDAIDALNAFRGEKHIRPGAFEILLEEADEHGASYHEGVEIRRFGNGNAHLIFDPETLREINLALAEFYGDTLPDSPEEVTRKRPGTDVAKNLAYYPTPRAVVDLILSKVNLNGRPDILEPQCGCGRFLDEIREQNPFARVVGVEYLGPRVAECRAKGHHVMQANFLQVAPDPRFDLVVMNPPFNGLEWRKHLDHARKFLKPHPEGQCYGGGTLICILPGTAYYDGHLDDLGARKRHSEIWKDLPVASFAESGTNIPTGYITLGPS